MVTASMYKSTRGISRAFENMDFKALVPLAFSTTAGILFAQEIVDIVLPQLNMSPDPTSGRGLGASAAVKFIAAMLLTAVAARSGSRAILGLSGALGVGMIGSAGADIFEMLQTSGLAGESTARSGGRTRTRTRSSRTTSRSGSTSVSSGTSRATKTSSGANFGSNRQSINV